jgi:hypothetical protein
MLIAEAGWSHIEDLRAEIATPGQPHIVDAAQQFVAALTARFASVALARMFIVLPFDSLPPFDQAFARRLVNDDARLRASTRVLSLLGSAGHAAEFHSRLNSTSHLAIPLLDRRFVQGIPMITKLLADLEVDLQGLDEGRPIATRRMLGGHNGTFYVNDAATAHDDVGRPIIPARDFVEAHRIKTTFGMGGAYLDGTLCVAILFCQEHLERRFVDPFASLISNFKMATTSLLQAGSVFHAN